jgi:hypothetical protein
MERMRQGLELAQRGAVTLPEDGEQLSAVVRSGNNVYQVDTRLLTCTCADYQKHLQACKHLLAVEIHLGALGLAGIAAEPLNPPAPESALNTSLPPAAPTTASWPIAEAPASLNIKLRVGQMELMYTMRDVDDLKLQRRATMALPWLQDILQGCEANLAARQQEAERTRKQAAEAEQVQQRTLDEQIAAAVAAALKAQANDTPPPRAPQVEPAKDTDPSWCAIHRCKMERRTNERGSWYSHRLSSGAYCKGE